MRNPTTGLFDTTKMDPGVDILSIEDKEKEIKKVESFIKARYPNANVDNLKFAFSRKDPMVVVVLGPRGGETKVLLDDGSGLQKSFSNLSYVKKSLGSNTESVIKQTSADIIKRKRELKEEKRKSEAEKINLLFKSEEIQRLIQRLTKEQAKVDQP